MAGGGGVDAVVLVESGDAAYAFEEEGDEGGVVLFGEIDEELAEFFGVAFAEVGGCLHPGEDDLRVRVVGAGTVDDGLEVGAGGAEVLAAEGVVGAEFEDEDGYGSAQEPVDTADAASRGLAADTGVDDAVVVSGGVELLLDEGGECLFGGKAVAGGEAIAEEEDDGQTIPVGLVGAQRLGFGDPGLPVGRGAGAGARGVGGRGGGIGSGGVGGAGVAWLIGLATGGEREDGGAGEEASGDLEYGAHGHIG